MDEKTFNGFTKLADDIQFFIDGEVESRVDREMRKDLSIKLDGGTFRLSTEDGRWTSSVSVAKLVVDYFNSGQFTNRRQLLDLKNEMDIVFDRIYSEKLTGMLNVEAPK